MLHVSMSLVIQDITDFSPRYYSSKYINNIPLRNDSNKDEAINGHMHQHSIYKVGGT